MSSSIVFVALVGAWLIYFVPSWLERRHDASQASLDDRDSESMRLLSARAARRRAGASHGTLLHELPTDDSAHPDRPTSRPDRPGQPVRPGRAGSLLLATLLTAALLALPVTLALASLGRLGWLVALAPAPLVVACIASLRARVIWAANRPARPVLTQTRAEVIEPVAVEPATVLHDEGAIRTVERAAAVAAARARAAEQEKARAELIANQKPGEWLPVEVPKPSYLLKPAAPAGLRTRTTAEQVDLRTEVLDIRDNLGQHGDATEQNWPRAVGE